MSDPSRRAGVLPAAVEIMFCSAAPSSKKGKAAREWHSHWGDFMKGDDNIYSFENNQ